MDPVEISNSEKPIQYYFNPDGSPRGPDEDLQVTLPSEDDKNLQMEEHIPESPHIPLDPDYERFVDEILNQFQPERVVSVGEIINCLDRTPEDPLYHEMKAYKFTHMPSRLTNSLELPRDFDRSGIIGVLSERPSAESSDEQEIELNIALKRVVFEGDYPQPTKAFLTVKFNPDLFDEETMSGEVLHIEVLPYQANLLVENSGSRGAIIYEDEYGYRAETTKQIFERADADKAALEAQRPQPFLELDKRRELHEQVEQTIYPFTLRGIERAIWQGIALYERSLAHDFGTQYLELSHRGMMNLKGVISTFDRSDNWWAELESFQSGKSSPIISSDLQMVTELIEDFLERARYSQPSSDSLSKEVISQDDVSSITNTGRRGFIELVQKDFKKALFLTHKVQQRYYQAHGKPAPSGLIEDMYAFLSYSTAYSLFSADKPDQIPNPFRILYKYQMETLRRSINGLCEHESQYGHFASPSIEEKIRTIELNSGLDLLRKVALKTNAPLDQDPSEENDKSPLQDQVVLGSRHKALSYIFADPRILENLRKYRKMSDTVLLSTIQYKLSKIRRDYAPIGPTKTQEPPDVSLGKLILLVGCYLRWGDNKSYEKITEHDLNYPFIHKPTSLEDVLLFYSESIRKLFVDVLENRQLLEKPPSVMSASLKGRPSDIDLILA